MNPTPLPPLPLFPVLAAVLALGSGCANTLRIHVESTKETNKGQILYMMVRSTDGDVSGLNEGYEQAASRVFATAAAVAADPSDKSDKKVQAILPGKPITFSMPRPEQKQLALYFFFSEPGAHWMTPIDPPMPSEIYVTLGTHSIKEVSVHRR